MTLLVTGGAGFIGSNFVHAWLREGRGRVVNVDALTYAGNIDNLKSLDGNPDHIFVHASISDRLRMAQLFAEHGISAVINFAAESHVDRSIHTPEDFVHTNVVGVHVLLDAARAHWDRLPGATKESFRFLHISTDEVFGTLEPGDPAFSETTTYRPNSPYAATKAAADHLVRAYHQTYGLPVLTTNCSNNYGPYQFPEKLIPLCLHNALAGKPLPIYGDGKQIRDWLYVEDHCDAIRMVLAKGRIGETYNVGGAKDIANLDVVRTLCAILDRTAPRSDGVSYAEQIAFVADRPGHDRRYAVDSGKIERELGWRARETFESGLNKTVRWYLDNRQWTERVTSGAYRQWIEKQYTL